MKNLAKLLVGKADGSRKRTGALVLALSISLPGVLGASEASQRIGFVDQAVPGSPMRQTAAALSFAASRGKAVRLQWNTAGGWRDAENRASPKNSMSFGFTRPTIPTPQSCPKRPLATSPTTIEFGGVLLVSGAAGRLVNDLGLESTPVRVLGPTTAAFLSGIHVTEKHRNHPAFVGMDASKLIPLTTLGGNAFADFFGTDGPHGDVLANGNAGVGECPIVEYAFGRGRVVFVGWRLPDFAVAADPHRPNLERLFDNLFHYLADCNQNRGRMIRPAGECPYVRLYGVPLLRAAKTSQLGSTREKGDVSSVILSARAAPHNDLAVGDAPPFRALGRRGVPVEALALTVLRREKPLAQFVSTRRTQQDDDDRKDREKVQGLRGEADGHADPCPAQAAPNARGGAECSAGPLAVHGPRKWTGRHPAGSSRSRTVAFGSPEARGG